MAGRFLARYVPGEGPQFQAHPSWVLRGATSTHGRKFDQAYAGVGFYFVVKFLGTVECTVSASFTLGSL